MEPEELEKKEFLISLRGYDRDEVDAFLRETAAEIRVLRSQLAEGAAVAQASPAPPAVEGRGDALKKVGEETSRILLAAEQVAEEIKEAARKEAAELLADSRHQAEMVLRQTEEDRKAGEEDLRRLKEARSILATQLEDVRRRLDETIARLTAPMDEPSRSPVKEQTTKEAATKASPKAEQAPQAQPFEVAEPAVEPEPPKETEPEPQAAPELAIEPESKPEAEPEAELQLVIEPEPEREPEVVPEPEPEVVPEPEPEVVPEPEPEVVPEVEPAKAEDTVALSSLLEQIREEREQGRLEVEQALASAATPSTPAAPDVPEEREIPSDPMAARDELLGELPQGTARRMKRLLQEDQNILLDKIRTARAKGGVDASIPSEQEQVDRFTVGLADLLGEAFMAGRRVAGADAGDPSVTLTQLVAKQLVAPLRAEVTKVVEAGLGAQDTATSIAERASDIFRVWKGVRTEMLGEGMAYSAFHQGLIDAWTSQGAATKHWVLSTTERECPRDVCKANVSAGPIAVGGAFPSGHLAPPAHGGCDCTLEGPGA